MNSSTVVASTPVALTARLAALADPVRLRLVAVLAGGGRCVCDLQAEVPMAAHLLSYHLRVLREAGLWAQASAAGLPLPGGDVSTEWSGRPCDGAKVRR